MKHHFLSSVAALCLSTIMTAPAANATDYVAAYAGYFDVTQDDNAAAQFGLQYRAEEVAYGIRPTIGFDVSTDDSVYGYAGLYMDIEICDSWVFTPNFVAGGYHTGDGKSLGHGIEFRSGLELSYEFDNQARLGAAFNHISNASLGDRNPGAETLMVVYQHPVNWW